MTTKATSTAADRSAIRVWNQDTRLFEDYTVGEAEKSIRRTITEGEVAQFNSMVMDLHPYVSDRIFAETEGLFKKRIVPGALVFSLGLGLMAQNNINSFSYGYDRLRFIKPVFVDDTIYTVRRVLEARPKHEAAGLLKVSYEVYRADDEAIVLYCEHILTVSYRNPPHEAPDRD